jgi:hypothetical protein
MDDQGQENAARRWPLARRVAIGIAAGLFAGVPQVLAAQFVGGLVGDREKADVGPRFIQRVGKKLGKAPSRPERWSLAAVFHFGYSAGWGAVYSAAIEATGARRVQPVVTGGLLGALIYALAFSRLGAGTLVGAERHPKRRGERDWAVQLTSAFSFALTLAHTYRWWRGRD